MMGEMSVWEERNYDSHKKRASIRFSDDKCVLVVFFEFWDLWKNV